MSGPSTPTRAPLPTDVAVPPARPVTPLDLLSARLADVAARLPAATDADLRADVYTALSLARGLGPYLEACTTPESTALADLAARTRSADWATFGDDSRDPCADHPPLVEQEMLSGHVEGQVLKQIVRLSCARRALDVGMFTGYSALAMAEALPIDGQVVACELDARVAAFAMESFAQSSDGRKISVEVGPADQTLSRLSAEGATFDVAFLDADKPGYVGYLSQLLDGGLVGPGGIILADNTLLQGEPYLPQDPSANGAAIAAFNQAVIEESRVEQVLLPIRDGLTLMTVLDPS